MAALYWVTHRHSTIFGHLRAKVQNPGESDSGRSGRSPVTGWLATWPLIQAMTVLSISALAWVGRLTFVVVRHFCQIHRLPEEVKAAAQLASAGLSVQIRLGGGKTDKSGATLPDATDR
jgi:hypothetical protein